MEALDALLVSLFDDNGLRRFVAQLPQGNELLAELPSPAAPFATVAFVAAQGLEKRGLVHDALDRLVHIRPNRHAEIERVRDRLTAIGTSTGPSSPTPHAGLCNVPRGSQYFIGRDAEIAQLEQQLRQSDAVCVAASVEGLAGIGKTELVIQLVHRLHKQGAFPGGIFWFNAENPDLTTAWGQTVADHLQVVVDLPLPERAKIAVHKLSSCATPLLIVLDNVESWSSKQRPDPLPQGNHVHLLVTTRHRNLSGAQFVPFEVKFLQKESALRLINKLSRRDLTSAPGIDDLLEYLDGHALAVELAGVYLCEFPSETPRSYLELLSEDVSIEEEVADKTRYERTVHKTFMAIWEQIDDADRRAWQLAACFATEPASYDLATAVGLDKAALRILRRWHLISDVQQGTQWTMHRLTRKFGIRISSPQDRNDALRQFVEGCARYAEAMDEHLGFQVYGMDRTHLDAAVGLAPSVLDGNPGIVAPFQTSIANALRALGEHVQARSLYQLALDSDLATFGTEHPNVAKRRNNLAIVLQDLGELKEARDLLQQSLDSNLANFGTEHPEVAKCRNNLAVVLADLGKLKEARELYQLALDSDLTTFGPKHPSVATGRNNIGLVLHYLDKPEEARDLLQQTLDSNLANFGTKHPEVAKSRNNLAMVLQHLGKLEEARDLYQLALNSALDTFGPEHPNVARIQSNLATLLRDLGELKEARELLQLALDSHLATFGPEHPIIAAIRDNLTTVLQELEKT